MHVINSVSKFFNNLTNVPSSDPDDSRRRKILNIILIGMVAVAGITALLAGISSLLHLPGAEDISSILIPSSAAISSCLLVYLLNRYWSGIIASTVFLVFLMYILTLADTPHELANGRSIYLLAIPIIVASVLLGSKASLIFWGLISIQLIYLDRTAINFPAIMSFFFLAIISWLSSRSLEQALKDVRTINTELDRRVEDRTRELSAALARELVEAGKTQAILEGIADGVIVFGPEGKSIVANPALSYLLGIPVADLMGVPMDSILEAGKTSKQESKKILSMLANASKDIPNVRFRWGDRTLLVNASPVQTGLGNSIGTVAVFRDFTREAEVEQMKNTFVGMVSHELRTPLNAIIGYAEMVRESVYGPITSRQVGIMERIENSGQRLLALVSDLLDQAQIDAGRMKIHNTEFKVSDLMDTLHALMDKQVDDKGLSLTIKIDPDMPVTLNGDIHRLQQILLNLVGNATKFTNTGGIDVQVHLINEHRWGFDVTDTGPGIPLDAQQYVFESFRQMEGVATREHGGIGLGLAIVKSLVGLMGGEIVLSSEAGKGTTFSVNLPFEPAKEKK
jgi:PAS domain S-box-containing protein